MRQRSSNVASASCTAHQAESFGLTDEGEKRRGRHANRQRQDALLQPAGVEPILQRAGARAMYLFPTKALAEDQLHEFQAAVDAMGAESRHSPMTATRRRMRAKPSGNAPTSC